MRNAIIIGTGSLLVGLGLGHVAFGPAETPPRGFPLAALAVQARLAPALQGGSVYGFKLFVLKPGSMLSDVGLRNGDVIKAIGGHPVIHSSTLPLAFAALEGDTSLEIDRQGEPLSLPCSGCAQKLRDYTWQATSASPVVDDGPSLQPRGGPTTSLPAGAVTALGNNRFRIVGGWRRVMGEASQFALQARVVPAFENGQPAGFKLFSIRPGSTVSQLGFLNGDIINAIQGRPLTGPESVMEAYTNNLHENVVAVTLKRSGSPLTLTYEGVEDGDAGVQPVP